MIIHNLAYIFLIKTTFSIVFFHIFTKTAINFTTVFFFLDKKADLWYNGGVK